MTHQVFISYAHHDRPTADTIVAGLEQAALSCWVAPRDILPGANWGSTIAQAIASSSAMVVVVSGRSSASAQVIREVERAVAAGLVVVPFRIDTAEPGAAMAYFLGTQHWLDASSPPLESHVERLGQSLHLLMHRVADHTPAPPSAGARADGVTPPGQDIARLPAEASHDGADECEPQGTQQGVSATLFLRLLATGPNRQVRVSMASILRIMHGDNQYLLVRNLHRHENFAPFGGVYKYFERARPALDRLGFRPHRPQSADRAEMMNDLRGFVRAGDLPSFLRWYRSGQARECDACSRELREELSEIGLQSLVDGIPRWRLRQVRAVWEYLRTVPGQPYAQLRSIDVVEPVPGDEAVDPFLAHLLEAASWSPGLLLATQDEISRGRSSAGDPIASHAPYLYGKARHPGEPPGF